MTDPTICPATGWMAVYTDHTDPAYIRLRHVVFWESDQSARLGVITYAGDLLVADGDAAEVLGKFQGYRYDPYHYELHNSELRFLTDNAV